MFFACVGSAHASLIDIALGNTSGSFTYATGGSLTPSVNLATLGSNLLLTNASIISPPSSVLNVYLSPVGTLFGHNYLSVQADGTAVYTLPVGKSNFGFTWGSLDAYNTVVLTDSRGATYSITGSDLLGQISGSVAGTTQTDVFFSDPYGTIVQTTLTSTANALETGNYGFARVGGPAALGSVPLPTSLPLFAAALMGFVLFAHYRKTKNAI